MTYNKYKNSKGLSLVVFALGLAALLGFAALAIDLGISNNIQNELQKVTSTSALVGALEMEPDELGNIDEAAAQDATVESFINGINAIPMLNTAQLVNPSTGLTGLPAPGDASVPQFVETSRTSRAVRIQSRARVQTFFMAVIGITNLQVNAQAAAINCPAYPELNLPPPSGSVVASDIRPPVGGVNPNMFIGTAPNQAAFMLGPPDDVSVALGPGGSVHLLMPAPIIDGPGADIYVKETGDLEGYYLYIGIDNGGGGTDWVNISCTGTPTENALANIGGTAAGAYADNTPNQQYKFYGSGLFDLATNCTGGPGLNDYPGNIRNGTSIMIVDDNVEDGIISSDLNRLTLLLGEHSSTSPGADVDSIAVLHHSRVIDYNATDDDNDGLLNPYEFIIGTDEGNPDTDGDGINDGDEIGGTSGFITNARVADTDGDGVNDGAEIAASTNPLFATDVAGDFDDAP
ncbi:MAG: TadG family pilus assembly protein [Cyanobacteriota bacterium]